MKRLLFLLLVAITPSVLAQNIPCMKIDYTDGQKIMQSISENVMVGVIVEDEAEFEKNFQFWISVKPLLNDVVFGTNNIKVEYKDKEGVFFSCDVYTKKEWENKNAKKINRQTLWFGGYDDSLADEIAYADKYYLQKSTISPDEKTELKYVVAKNPKAIEMYVIITIGNDVFEFDLSEE